MWRGFFERETASYKEVMEGYCSAGSGMGFGEVGVLGAGEGVGSSAFNR